MLIFANADSLHFPLADASVHSIATSPPYWGKRDYLTGKWMGGDPNCSHSPTDTPGRRGLASSTLQGGKKTTGHQKEGYLDVCKRCGARRVDLQIGREKIPDCLGWATGRSCGKCYLCHIRQFAAECWRVLRPEGTLWLNIGDSYIGYKGDKYNANGKYGWGNDSHVPPADDIATPQTGGLKNKDLVGLPFRVALALQRDGWWLRSDIIWNKTSPFVESVTDRPTNAHEHIFLFSKQDRYFCDMVAIEEPQSIESLKRLDRGISEVHKNIDGAPGQTPHSKLKPRPNVHKAGGGFSRLYAQAQPEHGGENQGRPLDTGTRNKRSVWNADVTMWKLRGDLSDDDRAYVLAELVQRGLLANSFDSSDDLRE